MNQLYKKGISLVALVITVIILIVLTATVMLTMSDNNMFGQTQNTVNAYNKKLKIEQINMDISAIMMKRVNESGKYTSLTEEEVVEVMKGYGPYDDETMMLTIEEGTQISLFEIMEEAINKYLDVITEEGKMIINTQLPNNSYVIEYTTDGTNWLVYTTEVEIQENDNLQVRVTDKAGNIINNGETIKTNNEKLASISVSLNNATYVEGNVISKSNLTVIANYRNGTSRKVTNYSYEPAGALQTTDTSVTITYTEEGITKTASQEITVNKLVTGIQIVTEPNLIYNYGDTFDTTGIIVEAIYADGSSEPITEYTISPESGIQLNHEHKKLTVSYQGKTATRDITVNKIETGITVSGEYRNEYAPGELFDTEGMTVLVKYSDGTIATVEEISVAPAEKLTLEDTNVSISYNGMSKEVPITVYVPLETIPEKIIHSGGRRGFGNSRTLYI